MRILLLGEYSRLHNSLKEGLVELGHEVILVSNGDGFKGYPADFSNEAKWSNSKFLKIPRHLISRIFNYDFAKLEHGIRFYFLLPKLKNFDAVQLINESPIQTNKSFELSLLKKVFQNNKKVFVLSSGVDYLSVQFLLDKKIEKSILQPLYKDPSLKKAYNYILEYTSNKQKKIHDFVYQKCVGIIATDMDYVMPLQGNSKFLGLIPNPINPNKLVTQELKIEDKIVIFLGINQWTFHQKGIPYFEEALAIIQEKYPEKVEVIVAKNIPYKEYINLYNKAHILLDQVYAYDQGYNALEAMFKGKVVFTGAEKEFVDHYNLTEKVAINAKPDVAYLVEILSLLIENPNKILAIGKRSKAFVEKEHDYIKIARKYLEVWEAN